MAMAHAAARFPSPSRPLSSTPRRPVGFHAHMERLRRGLLVAGAVHAPTPSRSHLLASGLTLPDLATTTPSYVFQVCPRAHSINSPTGSPPLRFAPFRPVLQGQRLRLVGPPDAPVAPHSLRSLVRPRQCVHRPDMSLGPGDCAALVNLRGIRRKENLPAHAGLSPLLLFTFVHRRFHNV